MGERRGNTHCQSRQHLDFQKGREQLVAAGVIAKPHDDLPLRAKLDGTEVDELTFLRKAVHAETRIGYPVDDCGSLSQNNLMYYVTIYVLMGEPRQAIYSVYDYTTKTSTYFTVNRIPCEHEWDTKCGSILGPERGIFDHRCKKCGETYTTDSSD